MKWSVKKLGSEVHTEGKALNGGKQDAARLFLWYCCSGGVERCGVRQVTAVYAGFWVERRTEHGVVQALPADAQGFCPKRPSVSGPRNATDCVMFAGNFIMKIMTVLAIVFL